MLTSMSEAFRSALSAADFYGVPSHCRRGVVRSLCEALLRGEDVDQAYVRRLVALYDAAAELPGGRAE
jgi:hypothetical protein